MKSNTGPIGREEAAHIARLIKERNAGIGTVVVVPDVDNGGYAVRYYDPVFDRTVLETRSGARVLVHEVTKEAGKRLAVGETLDDGKHKTAKLCGIWEDVLPEEHLLRMDFEREWPEPAGITLRAVEGLELVGATRILPGLGQTHQYRFDGRYLLMNDEGTLRAWRRVRIAANFTESDLKGREQYWAHHGFKLQTASRLPLCALDRRGFDEGAFIMEITDTMNRLTDETLAGEHFDSAIVDGTGGDSTSYLWAAASMKGLDVFVTDDLRADKKAVPGYREMKTLVSVKQALDEVEPTIRSSAT